MERTIIQGIKRLRVLTPYDYDNMDELVQDLSNALEESSYCRISPSKARKGRSWKRRSKSAGNLIALGSSLPKSSAVSEDSESSLDDRIRFQLEASLNGAQLLSDSDDIPARQQQLTSWRHAATLVESDSVNENFHPTRQHRRKRKFKRMAVDPQPVTDAQLQMPNVVPCSLQKMKKIRNLRAFKGKGKMSKLCDADIENVCGASFMEEPMGICGKRKRSMRERSVECAAYERHELRMSGCLMVNASGSTSWAGQNSFMEFEESGLNKAHMETSSSSLSSSESDCGVQTNDEGREADDEQSDFFHETGPTCSIPSWWEDENLHTANSGDLSDSKFEAILKGSFCYMTDSSKREYHLKVAKLQARPGREIRAGRRQLGKTRPAFSIMSSVNEKLSKFMQDPVQNEHTTQCTNIEPACSKTNVGDIKRRRRTPPVGPVTQGFIADSVGPIPESNLGNRMLRNMGWEPGTGLGISGQGIQCPLLVYIRAKNRGLGFNASPNQHSQGCVTPPPPPPPPPPSPQPVTVSSGDGGEPSSMPSPDTSVQFTDSHTLEHSASCDSSSV